MDMAYDEVLKRLRAERKRLSLTQGEMSRLARMSQSNYSKIERGSRRLSYYELKYLCDSDIDLYYVFTGCRCSEKCNEVFFHFNYSELLCFLNIVTSVAELRCVDKAADERRQSFLQAGMIRLSDWEQKMNRNVLLGLRQSLGYSQCEMAGELGVDVKKLRALENGRILPDSELLYKLYRRFQVSPAVVLKDKRGLISEIGLLLESMDAETGEDVFQFVRSLQRIS